MRRHGYLCSLFLLIWSLSASTAFAQAGGPGELVKLGELEVGRHIEQDTITLPDSTPGVTSLRIRVRGGRVVLSRVQVTWADGRVHTEDRRINLLDGERTRPIDPGAVVRKPVRVSTIYALREIGNQPAILEILGFKPAVPRTVPQAIAGPQGELIARRSLARSSTAETFALEAASSSTLPRIRIAAEGADVAIKSVEATYRDGKRLVVNVDANVPAGTATPWLPLRPDDEPRRIRVTLGAASSAAPAALAIFGERLTIAFARETVRPHARRAPPVAVSRDEAPVPEAATRGIAKSIEPAEKAADEREAASTAAPDTSVTCIADTTCTPVPVFFGTNRGKTTSDEGIIFTADRGDELVLGQATVTVPVAYRKKGEITRPSWWDLLSLRNPWTEDPSRHFTILRRATKVYATSDDFVAEVIKSMSEAGEFKDHAFVFIHGYNVTFDHALYRTAQISYDLGKEDRPFGTAFLFSWPAVGTYDSYLTDTDSAEFARTHLKSFLELIAHRTGARKVHIVAHSMGNSVLVPVLDGLLADEHVKERIGQVIFASPDYDAGEFKTTVSGLAALLSPEANLLTLYASSTDRAMQAARRAYGLPRAGDLIDGRPVITSGMDSIDVSAVSTAIFGLNHNVYADKRELLNDMRLLMIRSLRPPDIRDLNLKPETAPEGTYWRFVE